MEECDLGGYFLTNNTDKAALQNALAIFQKKDMEKHIILQLGHFQCIYFNKINLPEANHIFKKNKDYVIGVGTFFFKNKLGNGALEEIYNQFSLNKDESIFNKVKGHFNLIIYIDGQFYVVSDKTGTYHSYKSEKNSSYYRI